MYIASFIATLFLAYAIWCLIRFLNCYRTARHIGLPIVVVPLDFYHPVWRIASVPLRPLFQKHAPEWLAFRLEITTYGAEYVLRDHIVEKYGSAFTLCGIGSLQVWSVNADLSSALLQKPKEYPPSQLSQGVMGMLGPNVLSTSGETWQRQRRVVAPMINERISAVAWDESIAQTNTMVHFYQKAGDKGTTSSIAGIKQLAFNVLGAVAYGKPQVWTDPENRSAADASQAGFMDILSVLADNLVMAALVPTKLLLAPIMPEFVQSTGKAMQSFPAVTSALIAEERKNRSSSTNLMSKIVALLDDPQRDSKLYLNPDEVIGNMFQFTLAGYDTTANTMAYALTKIAIHPEWQDWILEEIDQVRAQGEDYEVIFPQLKRVLALMFETLRIHTPVIRQQRITQAPITMTTDSGQTVTIPPAVELTLSLTLLHTSPKYWGPDAHVFRPTRWIQDDGTLLEPAKGTFIPWSSGPRLCPGIKMAQVEFAAVLYTIFRSCRIEPVLLEGEDVAMARKRLDEVMWDSLPVITLQMNRPEEVKLKWVKRKEAQ